MIIKKSVNKLLVFILTAVPLICNAQWMIGITGGGAYNSYTSDKHYLSEVKNDEGAWGAVLGIAAHRTLKDWKPFNGKFGIQTEINWISKNHSTSYSLIRVDYKDNYFQIPIMANYSIGGADIRAFVNAGCFGAFKTNQNSRKNKFDLGGIGGIGGEWKISRLSIQAEARFYGSAVSTSKKDRRLNTPHYHKTLTLQLNLFYNL